MATWHPCNELTAPFLCTVIIPIWIGTQSAKVVDDQIWKECALLIQTKAHLTTEGLIKIVTLQSALNKGLPDRLMAAFPEAPPMARPLYIPSDSPIDPNWVYGFTKPG
jgi:hypothetical protein